MKELIKNNIIFLIIILIIVFNQNILILFGNLNSLFLNKNSLKDTEINLLKAENDKLKKNINELNSISSLNFYEGFNYEISKIIVRNIYQINETIIIEKGEDYGIEKGMAVLNENGLIGIINEVNKKTSEVLLISSFKNDISIKVGNAYGILSGIKNKYLIGKKISNYEDFNVGDFVYTSGLGNLPSDIYIGKVKEILPGDYNIEQQIYIETKTKIEDINYLIIIKNKKEN